MAHFAPLPRSFYARPAATVAADCLGKILVVQRRSRPPLAGRIVEAEAYLGVADLAAHSRGGRRTRRTEVMYGPAGHAYVFLVYGLHHHLNLVTDGFGVPTAVLVRAVEPLAGQALMRRRRGVRIRERLTSGLGKLCQAFGITLRHNGLDLVNSQLFLSYGEPRATIRRTPRVGVGYARHWARRRLRFIDADSRFLSRPPHPGRHTRPRHRRSP